MFMATPMRQCPYRIGPALLMLHCKKVRAAGEGCPGVRQHQESTMTTTTFSVAAGYPAARTAPKRRLLARFYDALLEARMRQAMREIAMHRHLIPADLLKEAGYQATMTKDGALPFTR